MIVEYMFPVVGVGNMVVTSDNRVVRLCMEAPVDSHAVLLLGRVDLERLSRMATLARYTALVDFDESGLPALLWHLAGLQSLGNGGDISGSWVTQADDGMLVMPINLIIKMARRVDDFQSLIGRPVEIGPELLGGVLSGEVRPDLMIAQDDIVQGRLAYTNELAALRLMPPDKWPAVDLELGLTSHRVADQIRRLLHCPDFPLQLPDDDLRRAEPRLERMAKNVIEEMYFDRHACQYMRWAALRAMRLVIHTGCLIDAVTICPQCARVRFWLSEHGPEVMGDTEQPRPSADELHGLLAQIDESLS